jgi:hypothetical protein
MAIIVRNSWSNEEDLLIGAGYGAFQSSQPSSSLLLGTTATQAGHVDMVAVCDRAGAIQWFRSHDVTVISVDGRPPSEWLSDSAES